MKMEWDDDLNHQAWKGIWEVTLTATYLCLLLSITRAKPMFCPSPGISNHMRQCHKGDSGFKLCSTPLTLGLHYPWNTIKHMQNEPAPFAECEPRVLGMLRQTVSHWANLQPEPGGQVVLRWVYVYMRWEPPLLFYMAMWHWSAVCKYDNLSCILPCSKS